MKIQGIRVEPVLVNSAALTILILITVVILADDPIIALRYTGRIMAVSAIIITSALGMVMAYAWARHGREEAPPWEGKIRELTILYLVNAAIVVVCSPLAFIA